MACPTRKKSKCVVGTIAILICLAMMGCTSGFEWLLGVDAISAEGLLHAYLPPDTNRIANNIQIIDVGPRKNYLEAHIPGSRWVDYHQLEKLLPQLSPDRTVPTVFTCPGGHLSALAVIMAKGQGFTSVASLQGGVSDWRHRGYPIEYGSAHEAGSETHTTIKVPISYGQQLATTVSGLFFKPVYMVLTLALCIGLWRARERDMVLMRWGLIAFLAGEMFCALNYLIFNGANDVFDMLHGLGMVIMGALISWALVIFFDERILGVSGASSTCAFQRLCGQCWKSKPVPCKVQRLLLFLAPVLAIFAFIAWCAPLRSLYRLSDVFGTPVLYSYSPALQLIDLRLYSFCAALFFLIALWRLSRGPSSLKAAQFPFFTGVGLLAFSLFRFFLLEAYRESPAWMDFWEETTELLVILGLGWFLIQYRDKIGFWPFNSRTGIRVNPNVAKAGG